MKCYDFELNLTAYIDGEIKEKNRKSFLAHKEICNDCKQTYDESIDLIRLMPKLNSIKTSSEFINNLNNRIYELDNKAPSLWQRLQQIRPFGYDPLPSFGFALSISLIIIASYFLLKNDQIPNLDINKFTNDSKIFNPSTRISPQKPSVMADSDSTQKKDISNRYDGKIKLVKGK